MKIVAISDTHGSHWDLNLPDGDILIHAGDFTNVGEQFELRDFAKWLREQPFKHKIVIAGNHDMGLQNPAIRYVFQEIIGDGIYLEDTLFEIGGLRIFGSPWTPRFYNWGFMRDRGEALKNTWSKIPVCDVLVTHGPPMGILDTEPGGESVGDADLLEAVVKVKPRVHIFGHIHHSSGYKKTAETDFYNVAQMNEAYELTNKPAIIEATAAVRG